MTDLKLISWCALCGTELYRGECCYRIGGRRICTDCLAAYARQLFCALLEVVE